MGSSNVRTRQHAVQNFTLTVYEIIDGLLGKLNKINLKAVLRYQMKYGENSRVEDVTCNCVKCSNCWNKLRCQR